MRIRVILICWWLRSLRVRWVRPIPGHVVYGLWHQDLPACMAAFRGREIAVMISRSRDGEWAALIAQALGYEVVRGSSSRGQQSIRGLLSKIAEGAAVGMALDGPRGPARVEKPGAKWLADSAQVPLLRLKVRSSCHVRLRSWDRTIFPLPFSRIDIDFGE